jgi:antirestriction protein ArdC
LTAARGRWVFASIDCKADVCVCTPPEGNLGKEQEPMQFDIYQEVTNQIVAMLEQGVVPWRSPILGRQKSGLPKNLESKKDYRGINSFLLAFTAWTKGYESSYWVTFNQAKEHKGSVKKGEKSSLVIFWKQYEMTDKETGEIKNVPVLRYYRVFNVEQTEGIPAPDAVTFTPIDFRPIEAAEAIAAAYTDGPAIEP